MSGIKMGQIFWAFPEHPNFTIIFKSNLLGKLKVPKRHFEINWPLAYWYISCSSVSLRLSWCLKKFPGQCLQLMLPLKYSSNASKIGQRLGWSWSIRILRLGRVLLHVSCLRQGQLQIWMEQSHTDLWKPETSREIKKSFEHHILLILKIHAIFEDVQMMLMWFFDFSNGFRFSNISGVGVFRPYL